jgi:2'-5' RNA ligase
LDVRWTTSAQWHVTLRFLGEVDAAELDALGTALDSVPARLPLGVAPVEALLGPATAWFPGRRVLQVPVAGLDELAGAVRSVTMSWGAPPEQSFHGHLTLARARGRRPGPAGLAGVPLRSVWPVGEVVLYSSTPGVGGARYTALRRVPLVG